MSTNLITFFKILFITFLIQNVTPLHAQICNKGVVDCTGQCGRFTDNDNDGICDFSPRSTPEKTAKEAETEAASVPAQKTTPKEEIAKAKKSAAKEVNTTVKETSKANKEKIETSTNETKGNITQDSTTSKSQETTAVVDSTQNAQNQPQQFNKTQHNHQKAYPLLEICALTLGLYFISWLLVKLNVWKKQTHRKIWNVILLITFLMSGVLGFFLVVQLNYHIAMDWLRIFMKLHVLFGIAMAIVSVIHLLWHLKYYSNMFECKNK